MDPQTMTQRQLISAAGRLLSIEETADPILVEMLVRFQEAVSVLSMMHSLQDQMKGQLDSVRGAKR